MNYIIEMDSGAMIHIQNFIKVYSAIQELVGDGYTDTRTQTACRARKPN
jgi:hypothetical protein